MESAYFMAKASHVGKETALASIADSYSKLDQQDARMATDELCQDKVGQSFRIPCFTGKSVRYSKPELDVPTLQRNFE